ncbi:MULTISPECIES: oligopeptide ABC transporter permease [Virgibacillus]|uniref:Stage 0 sporulation protein KC n=2 Tax=Virgibacillus TaxID=84406 RepID=A0A024QGJ2_9BACI|nr:MULTISPECIES: oligopeptide ABC transporter permease [Virgibacillus]EQB37024.1 peptide ABC transporter permease [Virgibacillus sp. CM-4]MYL43196.1 ABC transporter permease subunit [Virgibacillus massiliensis]GGJ64189.1 peptide ABC transporter permease [Virgibacillus kapii]CDQ41673.1 Stage 0 sporulation protein KC [Virgibacillus massiliensis]
MQSNTESTLPTEPENLPETNAKKHKSPLQLAFQRFIKNKLAVISVFVLLLIIITCTAAPLFTDQDPVATDLFQIEKSPTDEHILGTNGQGQDNFARLLYGGRISLIVGFSAMFFTLAIGVLLGSIAGYYGGKVDSVIMRAADIMLMLPFLVLVLTIMAIIGEVTIGLFVTIIAITSWPNLTRIIRATYLSLREQEFVLGARAIGASDLRIILKHFIPNAIGPIIVNATLMMATYIIVESGLSFIGFGIPQPTPTWGNMISEAQNIRILRDHPEAWIPPGVAILVTVLAINFIGDGLRDAFDPKSNRR